MSNDDIEKAMHGFSSGLVIRTEVTVGDWFTLGHHVGNQGSYDQAAFLDGMMSAFEKMGAAAHGTQMDYIGRVSANAIGTKRRFEVAEFLEELATHLRMNHPDSLSPTQPKAISKIPPV